MKSVRYCIFFFFIVTDYKKVWNFLNLSFTHTISEFFCSCVKLYSYVLSFKCVAYFLCICNKFFVICSYRHNSCLNRSKP